MQNHFDAEEAKRRLAHLVAMPETTSRRREIAALRQTLEMMAAPQPKVSTRRPAETRMKEIADDAPEKPSREVSRTSEGRKRVVVRKMAPEKKSFTDDDRNDRERMKRISDYGTSLSQGF